jgi:hypothetical protein
LPKVESVPISKEKIEEKVLPESTNSSSNQTVSKTLPSPKTRGSVINLSPSLNCRLPTLPTLPKYYPQRYPTPTLPILQSELLELLPKDKSRSWYRNKAFVQKELEKIKPQDVPKGWYIDIPSCSLKKIPLEHQSPSSSKPKPSLYEPKLPSLHQQKGPFIPKFIPKFRSKPQIE